jgi:hypothetical protein
VALFLNFHVGLERSSGLLDLSLEGRGCWVPGTLPYPAHAVVRDLAGERVAGPGSSLVRMYVQVVGPRCAGALAGWVLEVSLFPLG